MFSFLYKYKLLRGDITDNLNLKVTLRTGDVTQKTQCQLQYSAQKEVIT